MREEDIDKLIAAYLEGELTEVQGRQFLAWLKADPEHARQVARLGLVERGLNQYLLSQQSSDLFAELRAMEEEAQVGGPIDLTDRLKRESLASHRRVHPLPLKNEGDERSYPMRGRVAVWAVAASILLAVGLLILMNDNAAPTTVVHREMSEPDEPVAGVAPVAHLLASSEAVWSSAGQVPGDQRRMLAGRYVLESGAVELEMVSGVRVVIQSPCVLDLLGQNLVKLESGRVVARVPQGASGFTVEAGQVRAVDLGTEFGVDVADSGAVTTAVFEGEVVLRSKHDASPSVSLKEGFVAVADVSGRIEPAQPLRSLLGRVRFARTLEDAAMTPAEHYAAVVQALDPLVYLRFDEPVGEAPVNAAGNALRFKPVGRIGQAPGVFGSAASLIGSVDQAGGFVSEQPVDLGVNDAFTIELWCLPEAFQSCTLVDIGYRVSRPGEELRHLAVLELTGTANPNLPDQSIRFMHRNPPSFDLQIGANALSKSPHPTGRWVHLVAVKDGGRMKIYVDGILETDLADPQTIFSGQPLYCFLGGSPMIELIGTSRALIPIHMRPLQGCLDEVAIYTRALDAEEVAEHARLGREALQRPY